MILLFIYSIISFLVPIFIYRIMRRGTASYERLGEIRDLLRKQEFVKAQAQLQPQITTNQPQRNTIIAPPTNPDAIWDRTAIYGQPPSATSNKLGTFKSSFVEESDIQKRSKK
jgi:hypothetical protein